MLQLKAWPSPLPGRRGTESGKPELVLKLVTSITQVWVRTFSAELTTSTEVEWPVG